jgi:hypothetical protein
MNEIEKNGKTIYFENKKDSNEDNLILKNESEKKIISDKKSESDNSNKENFSNNEKLKSDENKIEEKEDKTNQNFENNQNKDIEKNNLENKFDNKETPQNKIYEIKLNSFSFIIKNDKSLNIQFSITEKNQNINISNLKEKITIVLKKNDENVEIEDFKIEEFEMNDKYCLKFSLKNKNEDIKNKILSTLFLKLNNEIIGCCEIVIIKEKEIVLNEIKECEKNISFFQNLLKDKNINILENKKFNNLLVEENNKKKEYQKYFEKNFK